MRIPFTAAICLLIVGALRLLNWATSGAYQVVEMSFKAAPGVTWFACMVPAVFGCLFIWRVFKLMERPALLLTLTQSTSVLSHHQKERQAALQASACFAVSAMLLSMMKSGQVDAPALVFCSVVFVYSSLTLSSTLLLLAVGRVRKVTRFVERNPVFG